MEVNNAKIIVTGGNGFLGSHVVEELRRKVNSAVIYHPSSQDYDLRHLSAAQKMVSDIQPTHLINLAARSAGIGGNRAEPASFFYDNITIGVNTIKAALESKVQKVVNIGSVCSYPKITEIPFQEENLWDGYPEETNGPYGIAKKAVAVYAQACEVEYGLKSVNLLLTNLYGPRDDFRDSSSHVIPALIKKIVAAKEKKEKEIVVWGDGSPSRDFLYVNDAAEGIVQSLLYHQDSSPTNLGGGKEYSIETVVSMLLKELEYTGRIVWDTSKPNGQPRRKLDISKAKASFQFNPRTTIEVGLKNTIAWYLKNKETIDHLPSKFKG